jgi:hypothetical protein
MNSFAPKSTNTGLYLFAVVDQRVHDRSEHPGRRQRNHRRGNNSSRHQLQSKMFSRAQRYF